MNILTDVLPRTITINGIEHAVDAGFRNCLKIINAFEDNGLTSSEKQVILLNNLYDDIPDDTNQALLQGLRFLNGGEESDQGGNDNPKLFSFVKDANLIYAAFRQTHGIDLGKEDLHWWEFVALFMDLGSDTAFCNLTSLRKRVKTGKATKEERLAARELGDLFDVPDVDTRSLEEKEAENKFMKLLRGEK